MWNSIKTRTQAQPEAAAPVVREEVSPSVTAAERVKSARPTFDQLADTFERLASPRGVFVAPDAEQFCSDAVMHLVNEEASARRARVHYMLFRMHYELGHHEEAANAATQAQPIGARFRADDMFALAQVLSRKIARREMTGAQCITFLDGALPRVARDQKVVDVAKELARLDTHYATPMPHYCQSQALALAESVGQASSVKNPAALVTTHFANPNEVVSTRQQVCQISATGLMTVAEENAYLRWIDASDSATRDTNWRASLESGALSYVNAAGAAVGVTAQGTIFFGGGIIIGPAVVNALMAAGLGLGLSATIVGVGSFVGSSAVLFGSLYGLYKTGQWVWKNTKLGYSGGYGQN